MDQRINWLHFSDLHYGQKNQNILLPKLRRELFRDIERLNGEIGKTDIVFFTGDLTFSGRSEEFEELNIFLSELWESFNRLGTSPYLIAIPGNHDLLRPDPVNPVVKTLSRYSQDSETRIEFWNDVKQGIEHYSVINYWFENFTTWYKKAPFPKPEFTDGIIPGDIAATVIIDGLKLKVIGLNSAFLDFGKGDRRGSLAISPHQLMALTNNDPFKWVEGADIALLLTHHDSTWYDKDSLNFYNGEINPPGTFFNHFCGHLHEPSLVQSGQIGANGRRLQLAPSLFGLERINNEESRIHGYMAGSYKFNMEKIIERIYPRTAYIQHGGGDYQIAQDFRFLLNKQDHIEVIHDRKKGNSVMTAGLIEDEVATTENLNLPEPKLLQSSKNIFNPISPSIGKELDQVPRIYYPQLPQHQNIRVVEQNEFVHHLSTDHYCWLVTDWNLSEDGFIGSVLPKLGIDDKNNFIVNLENITTLDELLENFKEQAGLSFTNFCNLINNITKHLLVFNQIDESIFKNTLHNKAFLKLLKSITDFCPNTYIVLITRLQPDVNLNNNIVRLTPLDPLQIKTYIETHPNSESVLTVPVNLAQIIDLIGGIPNRLDKFIINLKYASFQDLLDTEREMPQESVDLETIPKSLQQTIALFSDTNNKPKLKSFRVLKILTILVHGETFNNLKSFTPGELIHFDNIQELESYSLLEIIVKNKVLPEAESSDNISIKLFKVPIQIRDYINTMISAQEKLEILKNACLLYFGPKWREGSIKKLQSSLTKNRQNYLNFENCRLIVKSLLSEAIHNGNKFEIERSATLAVRYCEHISSLNDFKNAASSSEEISNLIASTDLVQLQANIAEILGASLRMNGAHEKAIKVLNNALETYGNIYSKADKNSILNDLAYAYENLSNTEEAIKIAKQIERNSAPNSVLDLTAKYIISKATLKDQSLLSRLRTLERAAYKSGSNVLANNISISIAEQFSDQIDKGKRFTKIIKEGKDDYNIIRATVKKVLLSFQEGDGSITSQDLTLLNLSYSYLYEQQMAGLFQDCHHALWLYCIKNKLYPELLNLFRYSSFVWRISGKEQKEKSYFNILVEDLYAKIGVLPPTVQTKLSIEYFNRRKLEIEN